MHNTQRLPGPPCERCERGLHLFVLGITHRAQQLRGTPAVNVCHLHHIQLLNHVRRRVFPTLSASPGPICRREL